MFVVLRPCSWKFLGHGRFLYGGLNSWLLWNMMKTRQPALKPLRPGQVCEVAGASVRIDLVGKTLVHFKRYKGKVKAVPTSFASKRELEKFLANNKANLVQE